MSTKYRYSIAIAALMGLASACLNDLNQVPKLDESTDEIRNEEGCLAFLAKIYCGFGLSGNQGPSGMEPDLQGPDQGALVFLRGLLSMQELPSDEAIWNWADQGIVELCHAQWDHTLNYAYTFYQRAMLNIRYCKEFLDIYTPDTKIPDVEKYRDEVRGIRDMNYYYLIDLYRNPGFVWDDSPTDDPSWKPSQLQGDSLFRVITADLESLAQSRYLDDYPSMSNYGRITKPVIYTLLAKMYLNAEVYTGQPMYDKAVPWLQQVMQAGFDLEPNYASLFCGENHLTMLHQKEIIYAIPFDNDHAKSFGSTLMVTTAAYGGQLDPTWFGLSGSWTCLKPTQQLIGFFDGPAPEAGQLQEDLVTKSKLKQDTRYRFFDVKAYNPDGSVQSRREVNTLMGDWNSGYLCYKFTNLSWDGGTTVITSDPNTDFPLFRLADIYLMYAECAVRGATGTDMNMALDYVNRLRRRAHGNDSQNITASRLTLDFLFAERARELYWEGHRRTDQIRFHKFTAGYAWAYKGGKPEGVPNIDERYAIYPISDRDLSANENLKQNPGYTVSPK